MSRLLAAIIGEHQSVFDHSIQLLEQATLNRGIDIALEQFIQSATRQKLTELSLDPRDTTAEELYAVLAQKVRTCDSSLSRICGITVDDTAEVIVDKVATVIASLARRHKVWCIKRSVLKTFFSSHAPNRTMKLLGYRSLASFLKKESMTKAYVIARQVEPPRYLTLLRQTVESVSSSDCELRSLEIVLMGSKLWYKTLPFKQHRKPSIAFPEVGAVFLRPFRAPTNQCLVTVIAMLLLTELHSCAEYAAFTKAILPLYGQSRQKTLIWSRHRPLFSLHGQDIHWHHLYRFVQQGGNHVRLPMYPHFEPHSEDWVRAEQSLIAIDESFLFWQNTHLLAYQHDNHLISLHLLDVSLGVLYGLAYVQAPHGFVSEFVKDELLQRYMAQPTFSVIVYEYFRKTTDTDREIMYA